MNIYLMMLAMIIVLALGAIFHERDIYDACSKYGESSSAMWTKKIKCNAVE